MYGFFRHHDLFSRGLIMSPALWVKDGEIFHHVARAQAWGDLRLYLDCGGREAFGYSIQHAEWMVDMLERKGFAAGDHFLWRPDKRGAHNERSWRRRLPKALRYLYD
jgi:predicted alpha/beta superfamily hydrolase